MMIQENKELCEWFFNLVGYFNHYSFFTDKKWEKIDGFKNHDEAEREFYQKDPCRNCGPGNGCDDCRGCKDGEISHAMYLEVKKLKDEYNKLITLNFDFDKILNIEKYVF